MNILGRLWSIFRRRDLASPHILVIDDFIPDPRIGAGAPRAEYFLTQLTAAGATVTFCPTMQENLGVDIDRGALNGATVVLTNDLGAYLGSVPGRFHAIVVSRPHNMRTFRAAIRGNSASVDLATLIYDAEAIFAARDIVKQEVLGTPIPAEEAKAKIDEELMLARGTDIVLAVSAETAQAFRAAGHPDVRVLGYAVAPNPSAVPFEQRNGFIFVGPTRSPDTPNSDAVVWFADQVIPRLRAELGPEMSLTLVGVMGSPDVRARVGAGIEPLGVINDLAETYSRARVFVAPTRFAAGIPLKVYHAAAHGIPAVITPLLACQIGWRHEQEAMIAETPDAFAAACIRLHQDGALWSHVRDCALERVQEDCSQKTFDSMVRGLVSQISGARP